MTVTPERPRAQSGRPGPRGNRTNRFTDEDIETANTQIPMAFAVAGLVSQGALVCPVCGTSKSKKVQHKTNEAGKAYWKCQKCKAFGSATKLLTEHRGYTFPDAVNTLLGRPTSGGARPEVVKELPKVEIEASFRALVDIDVYDAIRNSGSLEKAQEYYALVAHISPEAVREAGSTYIVNARALHRKLADHFGMDRLKAAGVAMVTKNGKDYFLFSDDYPVLEVHERACRDLRAHWADHQKAVIAAREAGEEEPTAPFRPPTCTRPVEDNHGHVVGMQFRPSLAQKKLVDAHKAWKKRWEGFVNPETGEILEPVDAWRAAYELAPEAAGERVESVILFLSLKGAGPESLVGCGLRRISELAPGADIYNVEGFKDLMAARTLGAEAYAIPGTGVLPSARTCELLGKHTQVVSLDGDEAGAKGRDNLMAHYEAQGVPARVKPNIRAGVDVADILVERHALAGCACETCVKWRANHSS